MSRIQPKQLITCDKNFNREAIQQIKQFLPNVNKEYQSVAIIGVQNSGKSTLLNSLFGTNFEIMKEKIAERTTIGVWISLDKECNIIVMDVEGNDSQLRANQQQYEKMVSTFALVQADTLMINIWSKTLGQYSGSQYQTLNAILDICISQFKQQSPKVILFCVRDFNEEEDEEGEIRRKIVKDVNNIWLKIQKPPEIAKYQNSPQKFFVVEVTVLRKFRKENPKNFLKDVEKLREKFVNPRSQDYLFKNKKYSHNLPLEDLPQLAENSWNSIITNKKLNLPNEKEQLSNFRCQQVLTQKMKEFQSEISKIQEQKKVVDFGKILEKYSQNFKLKTYNYGKHVVEEKLEKLKQQITDKIKKVINDLLILQETHLIEQFRNNIATVNNENSLTLEGRLIELRDESIQKFTQFFRSLNFEVEERKQRITKVNTFINDQIKEYLTIAKKSLNDQFELENSRQIRLLTSQLMKKYFGKDIWTNVQKQYLLKRDQILKRHQVQVQWTENRTLQPTQLDKIDQKMTAELRNNIREELKKSLMQRVFDLFLKEYTKNNQGVPYNFNILDLKKIAELYQKARDHARELVFFINQYNIKRSKKATLLQLGDEEKDQFFQTTWLSTQLNKLDMKMIDEHEKIVRRKKEDEMRKVPSWLIVIIIYFVYDDLWFPSDTHPITNKVLTLFLIFVTFFFSIGQYRAFMQLWKLTLQIGNEVSSKIKEKFEKK